MNNFKEIYKNLYNNHNYFLEIDKIKIKYKSFLCYNSTCNLSWYFLNKLINDINIINEDKKCLFLNNNDCNENTFLDLCEKNNLDDIVFIYKKNILNENLLENFDLLFIDTTNLNIDINDLLNNFKNNINKYIFLYLKKDFFFDLSTFLKNNYKWTILKEIVNSDYNIIILENIENIEDISLLSKILFNEKIKNYDNININKFNMFFLKNKIKENIKLKK